MTVRGWNCDKEAETILDSLNIPNKQFSKKMNLILKEWHSSQKQEELKQTNAKPEVKFIA